MSGDDARLDLQARMARAVEAQDFELAARLRDELAAAGHLEAPPSDDLPPSKICRQVPGAMGLGTDQQVYKPPAGWTPPPKPDLLTSNRKPGGRRRS